MKLKCDGLKGTTCSATVQFTKGGAADGAGQTVGPPTTPDKMAEATVTVPSDADGVGVTASFNGNGVDDVVTLSCDVGRSFACAGNVGQGLMAKCENNAPGAAKTKKAKVQVELKPSPPPKPVPPSKPGPPPNSTTTTMPGPPSRPGPPPKHGPPPRGTTTTTSTTTITTSTT